MMERAPPNDMVHVKLKISNVPKTKHQLRWGTRKMKCVVNLGDKRSYNFKRKPESVCALILWDVELWSHFISIDLWILAFRS